MDSSLPAESSMDELSEDSAIHCMQNEVWNLAMAVALHQRCSPNVDTS